MTRLPLYFPILALLAFALPLRADEPPPAGADLRARVERLEKELDETRAELAAPRVRLPAASDDPGILRDDRFFLRLYGYVQADVVAYNQASEDQLDGATSEPLNQDRFLIRRGRLHVDFAYHMLSSALELDGNTINGPQARVIDAEVSLRWPPVDPAMLGIFPNAYSAQPPVAMLTLGLFKTPFGFELGQRDEIERLFLERSNMAQALFPGVYDLGAKFSGGWRFLRYSLAAMNGDPIGDRTFAGRDPNQSKDFMGRVGVAAPLRRLGIRAGFSALWGSGFHAGTPATKDVLTWRDTNEDGQVELNEIQVIPGQAATTSQNFDRSALGGDLELTLAIPRLGPLMVYGELTWATNLDRALRVADPVAAGRDLRELGWYAAFTQEIGPWVRVGVRYDRYNPDLDASDRRGANLVPEDVTYSTLAATAEVHYRHYGRLVIEYDHNQNALGITPGGQPTTLGADQLGLRGEVVF